MRFSKLFQFFTWFLCHFGPNLTVNFSKWLQKVKRNGENCAIIFFLSKNIPNSPEINYRHFITFLLRYNYDSQKFPNFHVVLGSFFRHFGPNLTVNFQKLLQKVQRNSANCMKIVFWAKNMSISPQINYGHLTAHLGRYTCDFQKFSKFWRDFGSFLGHFGPNLTVNFQKWLQKVPRNGENSVKNFFWAENIPKSFQTNYGHRTTLLGRYKCDFQKFPNI